MLSSQLKLSLEHKELMPVNTVIKHRGDTAANWTSTNPVLAAREIGIETDTNKAKIGDGTTAWNSITTYFVAPAAAITSLTKVLLTSPKETTTVSATAATGTINFDVNTQADLYYTTDASANFTLNFRASSSATLDSILSNGQTQTVVFRNTNGATAYYATAFQIDGTSVTPKWLNGTAPAAGNASAVDVYTFAITKTATATYTVFASVVKFA